MLQIAFQLRTFMPSGNFKDNLGNGQFALDPSILTSLKLGPDHVFPGPVRQLGPARRPGRPTGNRGRDLLLVHEPEPGLVLH